MKQNNENHWYESVTEPLYEDSRTFGGLPSIKEGQLPNELPTRNYFTHQQQLRNLNKMITSTRTHKGASILQPLSSHATVLENSARPTNAKKSPPVVEQQQLTDQATIQRWLNTNGYKLSDFGLSDRTTSEAAIDNNIQVFESPDRSIGGDITKSYTDDVLSKIGLNSDQAMVTTDVTGATLKRPAIQGSSSRKEKVSKKKQTTKHGKSDHQKKTKANTTQRLAKIANLISLLKDYSSLKHKKQKSVPSKSKQSKHQQRQIPSVIPHHGEIVTSSEEVQEDETAASDKEAKMKGALMRFSTQSNLDGDYHKSLKSTSSSLVGSSLSSGVSPHHLVTVDTTTGKIYAERMIPNEDFDELGFAFAGGSKKTSLGFIPQQNTAENGIRRAKTPVEPAASKKKLSAKKHKSGGGKVSTRDTLLKRIGKQLSFISTDQLKRLDNTLDKLKHLHKKH